MRGLYESTATESGVRKVENTSSTLQEGLGIEGLGYIYSPLFISMQTSATFGFQQQRRSRDDYTDSQYGDANQFKQVFKILPSHPYNFELYGLRNVPMSSGGGSQTTVVTEYGAKAAYEMRPWNSSLTYINRKSRSDRVSENNALMFHTNYFNTLLGVTASCLYGNNESDTDTSLTIKDIYGLTFSKKYESARFKSKWTRDKQDQENSLSTSLQSSKFDQQKWHNELSLDFPKNFSALVSYDVSENDTSQVSNFRTTNYFNDSERYSFNLKHRLYRSLSSGFTYNHNYTESNSGRSTQENSRLNGSYTKNIPWGTILSSLSGGVSYLDNAGSVRTLSQLREVSNLTNSFNLNSSVIDRNTIIVRIIDKNEDTNIITLTEGIHYTVLDGIGGDFLEIKFISSPTAVPDLTIPTSILWSDYTYEVDFSEIASDYELRTVSWNYTLQLPLFNKLITPFYSYSDSEQTVMDGNYPSNADHSQNHTLGLGVLYDPFKGEILHSWLRTTTVSSDRLNASLEYSNQLTPFTSGNFTLAYENANTEDKAVTGAFSEQEDTLYSVQANLQTLWPQENITGSITGNYSLYKGRGETSSYSLYSVVSWHVGQIDLDLTASYTNSESTFSSNTTKNEFMVVKFILKRELF